jgi:ATP-dependent RNA helicase UAP56/SUB2
MDMKDRIKVYDEFKKAKFRILVTTDIFGRGIDVEKINIVINFDMAGESDQYLHRVGRAGRFGTKGLAISFISNEDDNKILQDV